MIALNFLQGKGHLTYNIIIAYNQFPNSLLFSVYYTLTAIWNWETRYIYRHVSIIFISYYIGVLLINLHGTSIRVFRLETCTQIKPLYMEYYAAYTYTSIESLTSFKEWVCSPDRIIYNIHICIYKYYNLILQSVSYSLTKIRFINALDFGKVL